MEITGTIEGNKHLGLTLKIDSIHSELVADMLDKQVVATVKCATPDKIRSVKQNSSMWTWASMLANAMNDAGFDRRKYFDHVLKKGGRAMPWSKKSVIDELWCPVQEAITGHTSTRKPKTDEYLEIYRHVDNCASRMTSGISIGWPCRENQSYTHCNRSKLK